MLASTSPSGTSNIKALTITVPVSGYQECGLSGKAGGTATGLSGASTYYFKVSANGSTVTEKAITTAADMTYTGVIALMNAQMTGVLAGVVWAINGGDLRCTSPMLGTNSTIALSAGTTGTNLFVTLTGFSAFDTAVAGLGPAEDPNGYSIIPASGFSKVYSVQSASGVTVQGVADATITGNPLVEGSLGPGGPWVTVGTLTAGVGLVHAPAGSQITHIRINGTAYTGGPLHCNLNAVLPNGNVVW
jgi:hypothetical protein